MPGSSRSSYSLRSMPSISSPHTWSRGGVRTEPSGARGRWGATGYCAATRLLTLSRERICPSITAPLPGSNCLAVCCSYLLIGAWYLQGPRVAHFCPVSSSVRIIKYPMVDIWVVKTMIWVIIPRIWKVLGQSGRLEIIGYPWPAGYLFWLSPKAAIHSEATSWQAVL